MEQKKIKILTVAVSLFLSHSSLLSTAYYGSFVKLSLWNLIKLGKVFIFIVHSPLIIYRNQSVSATSSLQYNLLAKCSVDDLVDLWADYPEAIGSLTDHFHARFYRLVEPFVQNLSAFIHIMQSSSSFISGLLPLLFWFPKLCAKVFMQRGSNPDLDLYCKRSCEDTLLNHLTVVEGFSYPKFASAPSVDPKYYSSGFKTGIHHIHQLVHGKFKIDLIVSTNECAYYPVPFSHLTCVMNILSPDYFVSFYPAFTQQRLSLINNSCFVHLTDIVNYGDRTIRSHFDTIFNKYRHRGFILSELATDFPVPHSDLCLGGHCRMARYSNDLGVFRVDFLSRSRYEFPDPFVFTVYWSLGGVPCFTNPQFVSPQAATVNIMDLVQNNLWSSLSLLFLILHGLGSFWSCFAYSVLSCNCLVSFCLHLRHMLCGRICIYFYL